MVNLLTPLEFLNLFIKARIVGNESTKDMIGKLVIEVWDFDNGFGLFLECRGMRQDSDTKNYFKVMDQFEQKTLGLKWRSLVNGKPIFNVLECR